MSAEAGADRAFGVKICGLKDVAGLTAALDAGADMVGLVFFEKSPRHVSLAAAQELAAIARGRAKVVALTVDAGDEALDALARRVAPDFLQLHGSESPARGAQLRARHGFGVIRALGVAEAADLAAAREWAGVADHLLFDARPPKGADRPGGNGAAFDWTILGDWRGRAGWLLSGGLDAENVARAIAVSGAPGVDVSSGVESAPGVKDPGKIAAFVAAARRALRR